MLTLCERLAAEKIEKKDIENILKHEDYRFEFLRYKGRVSEEQYIDYLLQINTLNEEEITNMDLKAHHRYYKDLINNFDFYREKLSELEELLTPSLMEKQVSIALKGLPEDIKLPDLNFIFTIGIGQSFGYVYENGMHFDFLQLVKDKSISEFCSTIAHEVHHVGINTIMNQLNLHTISLEGLFYLHFIGEGLAVKYCNNAEGVLSKGIYCGDKNIGLDAFTWKYLNEDFYNTMAHFQKDIRDIRENNIKSVEELNKVIKEYWMNFYTEEQTKGEIPKLKHFRVYSFGNEIWGIIHDCFGKNAVFETINNPDKFPTIFNKALDKIGYGQFKI
jgi:uncharacterized protein YjaZ